MPRVLNFSACVIGNTTASRAPGSACPNPRCRRNLPSASRQPPSLTRDRTPPGGCPGSSTSPCSRRRDPRASAYLCVEKKPGRGERSARRRGDGAREKEEREASSGPRRPFQVPRGAHRPAGSETRVRSRRLRTSVDESDDGRKMVCLVVVLSTTALPCCGSRGRRCRRPPLLLPDARRERGGGGHVSDPTERGEAGRTAGIARRAASPPPPTSGFMSRSPPRFRRGTGAACSS